MSKCISCTDTISTLRLPIFLAIESRQIPLLWTWLNVECLGVLDIAVSRHSARKPWEKAVVNNIEVDWLSCNQRMASQPLVDDMDDA